MKRPYTAIVLLTLSAGCVFLGCAHRDLKVDSPPPAGGVAAPQGAVSEARVPARASPPAASQDPDFSEFEDEFQQIKLVSDPLAPYNRAVFYFNDKLYFWLLKPLARGYTAVTPGVVRSGVRNFFNNLLTPIRFVNCILQGKGIDAGTELGRFAVNTTVGVLGFWDPAKKYYQLEVKDEDLGQTIGAYGIGNGFYIVWPILGASTLRDSIGFAGDLFLNPISYIDSTAWSLGVGAYRRFNDLSFRIGEYEAIKQASLDPYQAVRDGYIQFRNARVDD